MMRLIPIFLACSCLLTACFNNTKSDAPSWIDNPDDGAVGSSTMHIKGRYYQEELAITRARERLAARYGVEISSVHTIQEKVVNEQAYVTSNKLVLQEINNKTVKAHVRATWHDKAKDEVWAWVYPVAK